MDEILAGSVASLVGKDNCEGFCNEEIDFDLITLAG